MPTLEYFLLAETVTEDRSTGALSIFNVLTEWRSPSLPKLWAVSGWLSSPEEVARRHESQIKLRFTMPGGEQHEFRGNMASESKHQHINFVFGNIEFPESGELIAELMLDDEHKATHTVTVILDDSDVTAER